MCKDHWNVAASKGEGFSYFITDNTHIKNRRLQTKISV